MTTGFIDPAFFKTIQSGSSESIPVWMRQPLRPNEKVPLSVIRQAIHDVSQSGFAPNQFTSNGMAQIFFSTSNRKWCQFRIVEKIREITNRTVGVPDTNNVVQLMMSVWEDALAFSFLQIQTNVHDGVSLLNRYLIDRAAKDIQIGIRAQSAYISNVAQAPMYDDPSLTTSYVGGTKLSQGALSNDSILPDSGTVQPFQSQMVPKFKSFWEPL